MVRPCKYASAEERLAARRLQNSRNVKAWRNRKKGTKPDPRFIASPGIESSSDGDQAILPGTACSAHGSQSLSSSSSDLTRTEAASIRASSRNTIIINRHTSSVAARKNPWDTLPEAVFPASNNKASKEIDWNRLLGARSGVFDMNNVSGRQPIDLMFGFSEALIDQYSNEADAGGTGIKVADWARLRSMQSGLQSKDKLMELSVLGSASQYLARVSGDANMLRLSYEMYQKTLQALRHRIESGSAGKDGVVVGIANNSVLTIEVMEAASAGTPQKREWKAGLRAGARMAYRAGPQTFSSRLGLSVLRSLQSKYHLFALGDGEPVLFEGADWESIPYELDRKEPMDELFHIINSVIKVLWRVRSFLTHHGSAVDDIQHSPEVIEVATDLWEDISDARSRMSAWLSNVKLDNEGELFTIIPAGTLYDLDGTIVTTALDFVSKEVATNLHFYWFYELIILQSAIKIQSFLPVSILPTSIRIPTSATDDCAMLIIRSAEYVCHHLETLGTALTWFAFVCLRFAMVHFADHATTSRRHRCLLTWTYRATEAATMKHFLGRKGQFVIDSIWGTIDEVIPGLQPLILQEGLSDKQTDSEDVRLSYPPFHHKDLKLYLPSEADTTYGFRFRWQEHKLSMGGERRLSFGKGRGRPSTFAAGSYQTSGQLVEEARWAELRRETSTDNSIDDDDDDGVDLLIEDMSPNIDPVLIDPELQLCDTNFLPITLEILKGQTQPPHMRREQQPQY